MENGGATLRKMVNRIDEDDSPILSFAPVAMDMALGKVARQVFDCDAVLKNGEVGQVTVKTMLDSAPKPGLLVIVNVAGSLGILALDGMLINGLVELMAGASDRAVYRRPREPTLIDIALCREFCDLLLAEFPRKLVSLSGQSGIGELAWQDPETDASRLAFVIDDKPLARLTGKVDLQDGLRGGEISLSLPMHVWQGGGSKRTGAPNADWSRDLGRNVLAAAIPLRANLDAVEMPLARVLALKPGDLIEISPFTLSDLHLVTMQGTPLLRGRLGQENGKKAVAIDAACDTPDGPMLHLRPAPAPQIVEGEKPAPGMPSPDISPISTDMQEQRR